VVQPPDLGSKLATSCFLYWLRKCRVFGKWNIGLLDFLKLRLDGINRELLALIQADVAAEEWDELLLQAKAGLELVGAFDKEGSLLGKEERQPRDIELAATATEFTRKTRQPHWPR